MYLSLKEIKNEIIKIQNQLEHWCTKKKINFERTQPKSFKINDVIVQTSHINNDPMAMYMIKDEECDTKIYALQQSLLSYQQLYLKEIERMSQYEEIPLIAYLKEEQNWNWKKIDKLMHRGNDYSRTKYRRYKKENSITLKR